MPMGNLDFERLRHSGKVQEQDQLSRRQKKLRKWTSAQPASGVRRLTVEEYRAALERERGGD